VFAFRLNSGNTIKRQGVKLLVLRLAALCPSLRCKSVIRVYDDASNVIETREHKGDFKEW
jgi:hypothetical protein